MKTENLPKPKYVIVRRQDNGALGFVYWGKRPLSEVCKESRVDPVVKDEGVILTASSVSRAFQMVEDMGGCTVEGPTIGTSGKPQNR